MATAQQAAINDSLLSGLGLPTMGLVGTNFVSTIGVCAQAASTCTTLQTPDTVFQNTLLPSLGILNAIPGVTAIKPIQLLANEGETSSTTITSGVTIANGMATDWTQREDANSTLTNVLQTVPNLLSYLGVSGGLLSGLVTPVVQTLLNAIAPNETASQSVNASGVFSGQASNGTPTCTGTVLYNQTFTPNFAPTFTDVLNTSGANGANGGVATSDTIKICGNAQVAAAITPIGPGTIIVASTAAGASTLSLLQ